MPPEPPEPIPDPDAILDPEAVSDISEERIECRPVTEVWSEIENTWTGPVLAGGFFREELERDETALWLRDSSLLDLFLQADRALPAEQRIMSGTKLPLRALRQGDAYTAKLTAPKKAVGLLSFTYRLGGWHGTLPSHDMTATLEIRAGDSQSQDGTVLRRPGWPTTLMTDLGQCSIAKRHMAAAGEPTLEDPISYPFRFPSRIPKDPSEYTVKLSAPAIFMYDIATHSEDRDEKGHDAPCSFDVILPVNKYECCDRFEIGFEASDAGRRPRYNRRVNQELVERFGHPSAELKLHLNFEARTTALDLEMAQARPSHD